MLLQEGSTDMTRLWTLQRIYDYVALLQWLPFVSMHVSFS